MATKAANKRLLKEYASIQQQPPPFIHARPSEKNILEWHYILMGPPDSPFRGGEYHGQLLFPSDYPFKPPSIQMYTPSGSSSRLWLSLEFHSFLYSLGRFQPSTRLCLTMSDFHRSFPTQSSS